MGLLPVLIAQKSNLFLTLTITQTNRIFLLFTDRLTSRDIIIDLDKKTASREYVCSLEAVKFYYELFSSISVLVSEIL